MVILSLPLNSWWQGRALAQVLFGQVNPSGKLPLSFPSSLNETWLQTPSQFPGVNNVANFSEGIFMGYRWFDFKGIRPAFSFGFGLSFTTFEYSALQIRGSVTATSNATVSFTVKNTGERQGAEIAQLYLGFPKECEVPMPPRRLINFEKVSYQIGFGFPWPDSLGAAWSWAIFWNYAGCICARCLLLEYFARCLACSERWLHSVCSSIFWWHAPSRYFSCAVFPSLEQLNPQIMSAGVPCRGGGVHQQACAVSSSFQRWRLSMVLLSMELGSPFRTCYVLPLIVCPMVGSVMGSRFSVSFGY